MNRPWMKFNPAAWRAEPRLRMCSLAARGLWIDLITYMHEGQPYGHLTIDGVAPGLEDIASLVSRPMKEVRKAFAELEVRQVFSRSETDVIFSRRMVRDNAKYEQDQLNGKGGGSPRLVEGVNPPVKAKTLELRTKNLEIGSFKSIGGVKVNPRRDWTPPKHGACGKGRVYIESNSPEWQAYAEDFRAVTGADPAPNDHGGKWFKTLGEAAE